VLARGPGFQPDAPIFAELKADPILKDRIFIAEPWDVGPGGYQLGRFPPNWLEWNDKYRDDVRRFWRGHSDAGSLATRMAGSADIFGRPSRSVNFLAAHDGFTLADVTAYAERHNDANGESNRDGQIENYSSNHGAEGVTDNLEILRERNNTLRVLLATLFASSGTIMLTAGDEMHRTQHGNNNAYCQDNPLGWVNWQQADKELFNFVTQLSRFRNKHLRWFEDFTETGTWTTLAGQAMQIHDWHDLQLKGFAYTAIHDGEVFEMRIQTDLKSVTVEIR
jgi:glycogen operon protein